MSCPDCPEVETYASPVDLVLRRAEVHVVVEEVPADLCPECGDCSVSDLVHKMIEEQVEEALRSGAQVEILRFAAP
jgi:peptide subunit release factor 1 (eRF1)